MKRKIVVAFLRWIACGIGLLAAIVGGFVPSVANEANFVCWGCIFIICIPYPVKE